MGCFTRSLGVLGGFTLEPRIGCQKILSEPLTRDMIQSWLETTAICIAVMSAASGMLLSYYGLQFDMTLRRLPRPLTWHCC